MNRRDFLSDVTRTAALCAVVPNVWRVTARPHFADDPFQLGVACGDPHSLIPVVCTDSAVMRLNL